MAMCIFIAV